ncbi:hypothetical protein M9H77_29670 [Catharanthus roseus]|uniref:Uncharacterized protein n=1 Tax=Catharanthus roseus TaxID=4058 RepID=A0ACB9ZV32_CATRO|nr:hypothetical protein M9H77_29670 [Catharanthus roseus]
MADVEDPITATSVCTIDEAYEFSAPKFYNFMVGETEAEVREAEMWFESKCSYAPSPFMMRIKTGRTLQLDTICDFSEGEQIVQKVPESSESKSTCDIATESSSETEKQARPQPEFVPAEVTEEVTANELNKEAKTSLTNLNSDDQTSFTQVGAEACTPAPQINTQRSNSLKTDSKKHQTARRIASMIKNPSELKSKHKMQQSEAKSNKPPTTVRRDTKVKTPVEPHNLVQENQAIKRQKLEGGKSRQILNVKPQILPHKSKPGLDNSSNNLCLSSAKTRKEDRKIYVREQAAPFISMAEMMKKFQSNTREMSLSRTSTSLSQVVAAGITQGKLKLTLTQPKEPEFETAQRVRSVKIKSSAELEEEMMAKMPKFKARPLNKKILEAPTLLAVPRRSTPQLPLFKEFHLETMTRASQTAETSSVASTESSKNHQWNPHHLTAPKSPHLQTLLRARPPKIKSSQELEKEELEKIPKFKARPLNKKVRAKATFDGGLFFLSKRFVGLIWYVYGKSFRYLKVKVNWECFATLRDRLLYLKNFILRWMKESRLLQMLLICLIRFTASFSTLVYIYHFINIVRPLMNLLFLFQLSLHSEPQNDKPLPRNTNPHPFHLHTEERGAEKEKKLFTELLQKQLEEEKARVPRANPYPYTTDYPVVPPKPEPKPCTRPEPFQLESLIRHEEEIQREMEERRRMEMEEAQRRIFKAQPILNEDPIPVPEKIRKPLTDVQEFNLHVDHRAVDRAEFDKKIKEKEMMYKRYREEAESAKQMEEEKALKQLRRTLVPHARPVPDFNHPFLPQKSSKQVTKPKSPRLHIMRRKERRTMMGCQVTTATSSAVSQMR